MRASKAIFHWPGLSQLLLGLALLFGLLPPHPVLATDSLAEAGAVAAWGHNDEGQSNVPTGLAGVTAIAAGDAHSLALKRDGTVVAWGYNNFGQSGVPTGLADVTAIAAGRYHSLALTGDGTVVAWGYNDDGQSTVPEGLVDVTAIAAGVFHSLALTRNGAVVAWGANYFGQSSVPTGLAGVTAIAAGRYHSLALTGDGTVVAWGDNGYGQSTVPEELADVTAIAAGVFHSLALTGDGTIVAWGNNDAGQSSVPAGLIDVTAIAAGAYHSLALVEVLPVTVSITVVQPNPTNASTVDFRIHFTQPVIGVDASDFALTTNGIQAASISSVSGDATTYSVTVHSGSGDGALRLDLIDDNSIRDPFDNPLGGIAAGDGNFTGGESYTIDKTAPTITLSAPAATSYTRGQAVAVDYTCVDSGVGLATCGSSVPSGAALDTTTVGEHTFTVTATDSLGNTASQSVTYTVINQVPVAGSQSVTTPVNQSVLITLVGTDGDGDVLTYTVVSQPQHGTLSGTAPTLTYTPNADFTGVDALIFSIHDGLETSTPATVTINVIAADQPQRSALFLPLVLR